MRFGNAPRRNGNRAARAPRKPNYAPMGFSTTKTKQTKHYADTRDVGKPHKSVFRWLCLSIALFIAAAAMSIYIACGCLYNDNLYIVKLKSNDTIPVQVRLGYLGTCVTIDGSSSQAISNTTACIAHNKYADDEPLANQFTQELMGQNNTGSIQGLNSTLSSLLPLSETLRKEIFPSGIPIGFLVLFLSSTVFYWLLSAAPSSNKAYKFAFALTTILNAYGLMLGFMLSLATLQACKGLKFPATGENQLDRLGVYVDDFPRLQYLQWATCALCCLEQISIAVLFVRRSVHRSGDAVVTILPLYMPFAGTGRR